MTNLKKITFGNPEGLYASTAHGTDNNNPLLTEVIFGDNIKVLNFKSSVFSAANLDVVTLPKNLENVEFMFTSCNRFVYEGDNPNIILDKGVLYYNTGTAIYLKAYPRGKTDEEYTVLDGTSKIEDNAFAGHQYLKKVTVPDTLTKVGQYAFEDAVLEEIVIPYIEYLTFSYRAFYSSEIKKITIADDTRLSLEQQAFQNCIRLKEFPYQHLKPQLYFYIQQYQTNGFLRFDLKLIFLLKDRNMGLKLTFENLMNLTCLFRFRYIRYLQN